MVCKTFIHRFDSDRRPPADSGPNRTFMMTCSDNPRLRVQISEPLCEFRTT
jgi:hypothetical protein